MNRRAAISAFELPWQIRSSTSFSRAVSEAASARSRLVTRPGRGGRAEAAEQGGDTVDAGGGAKPLEERGHGPSFSDGARSVALRCERLGEFSMRTEPISSGHAPPDRRPRTAWTVRLPPCARHGHHDTGPTEARLGR